MNSRTLGNPTRLIALMIMVISSLVVSMLSAAEAQAAPARWSIVPSPNKGIGDNTLDSVSCTSSNMCMAVGSDGNYPLIESWNGVAWSVIPSPENGTKGYLLLGVSCPNSKHCVAVGRHGTVSPRKQTTALIETWNGSNWTVASHPNPLGDTTAFESVACASPVRCIAVGYDINTSSLSKTLVESWNGTDWSFLSSPNKGAMGSLLTGVSCSRSTSCMAVGYYADASGNGKTLVESWSGTAWSILASPNTTSTDNLLRNVSCSSRAYCVAVGLPLGPGGQPFIESWDGVKWSINANPGPDTAQLTNVSCTTRRVAWWMVFISDRASERHLWSPGTELGGQ